MNLAGRVIVVTGASRGIGKALALGLAEQGAAVVCAARSLDSSATGMGGTVRDTVAAIEGSGGKGLAVKCDIGLEADIKTLVNSSVATFGRIDALVNNAMTPTREAFATSSVDQWDESMRVNVRSLYLFTQAVTPVMQKQGGGAIVNVSSHGADPATQPFMPDGYLFYVVAKAALERYTAAAAPELAPIGITINALRPGAVRTENTEWEFGPDHDWSGWAEPASVVPAVSYLCAPPDNKLTGRVLDVAGFGTIWPE
jgi:NAD(P)-dependent dehydrogenase (short-subunit alcohol dehydrogenase family)